MKKFEKDGIIVEVKNPLLFSVYIREGYKEVKVRKTKNSKSE